MKTEIPFRLIIATAVIFIFLWIGADFIGSILMTIHERALMEALKAGNNMAVYRYTWLIEFIPNVVRFLAVAFVTYVGVMLFKDLKD
jgi:hypothetical protein